MKKKRIIAGVLSLMACFSLTVPTFAVESVFYVESCEKSGRGIKVTFSGEVDENSLEQVVASYEGTTKSLKVKEIAGNAVTFEIPFVWETGSYLLKVKGVKGKDNKEMLQEERYVLKVSNFNEDFEGNNAEKNWRAITNQSSIGVKDTVYGQESNEANGYDAVICEKNGNKSLVLSVLNDTAKYSSETEHTKDTLISNARYVAVAPTEPETYGLSGDTVFEYDLEKVYDVTDTASAVYSMFRASDVRPSNNGSNMGVYDSYAFQIRQYADDTGYLAHETALAKATRIDQLTPWNFRSDYQSQIVRTKAVENNANKIETVGQKNRYRIEIKDNIDTEGNVISSTVRILYAIYLPDNTLSDYTLLTEYVDEELPHTSGFFAFAVAGNSGRYEVDNVLYESVSLHEADKLQVNSFEKIDENTVCINMSDNIDDIGRITVAKDGEEEVAALVTKEYNKLYISLPEEYKTLTGKFIFKVEDVTGINGEILNGAKEYCVEKKGIYADFSNAENNKRWKRTNQNISTPFSQMSADSEGYDVLTSNGRMALLAKDTNDTNPAFYEGDKKINSYMSFMAAPTPLTDYMVNGDTEFSFDIVKDYDKTDSNTSVHAFFRLEDMKGTAETNDTNTRYKGVVKNTYSITYFEYADKYKYNDDGSIKNHPVIKLKKYTKDNYDGFTFISGYNDEMGTTLKSSRRELAVGEKIRIKVILSDNKDAFGIVGSTKIDVYIAEYDQNGNLSDYTQVMTYTDNDPILSGGVGFATFFSPGRFEVGDVKYVGTEISDVTKGKIADSLAAYKITEGSAVVEKIRKYSYLYNEDGLIVSYPDYIDGAYYLKKDKNGTAKVKITKSGHLYALSYDSTALKEMGFEETDNADITNMINAQSKPLKVLKKTVNIGETYSIGNDDIILSSNLLNLSINSNLATVVIMDGTSVMRTAKLGCSVYKDTEEYKITALPDRFEDCGFIAGFSNGGENDYRPAVKIQSADNEKIFVFADRNDVEYFENAGFAIDAAEGETVKINNTEYTIMSKKMSQNETVSGKNTSFFVTNSKISDIDTALIPAKVYSMDNDKEYITGSFFKSKAGDQYYGYTDGTRFFTAVPGVAYAEYKNYPNSGRTEGGRMWSVFMSGGTTEEVSNCIILVSSNDEGKTFSDASVVIDPDNTGGVRIIDPVAWIDPNGKMWVFYNQGYMGDDMAFGWGSEDRRYGVWAVTCDDPYNEYPKWSEPIRICDGTAARKPIVLSTGEWIIPAYTMGGPYANSELVGANLFKFNEYDEIWTLFSHVDTFKGNTYVEHSVIENSDKTLRVFARRAEGMYSIVGTRSEDGITWTEPELVKSGSSNDSTLTTYALKDGVLSKFTATEKGNNGMYIWGDPVAVDNISEDGYVMSTTSSRQGAATIPGTNGEKVLFVYHDTSKYNMGTVDSKTYNELNTPTRRHLTAALSEDGGKTFPYKLELSDGGSYSDIEFDSNGNIFITYDNGRTVAQEILISKITIEDIKASKLVTPSSYLNRKATSNGRDRYGFYDAWQIKKSGNSEMAILESDTSNAVFYELASGQHISPNITSGKYNYILKAIPSVFKGASFAYGNQVGNPSTLNFNVVAEGDIYVITSNKKSASSHEYYLNACAADMLEKQGFEEVTDYIGIKGFLEEKWEFAPTATRFNVYKKHFNAGESFSADRVSVVICGNDAEKTANVKNYVTAHCYDSKVKVDIKLNKAMQRGKLIICAYSNDRVVEVKSIGVSENDTSYSTEIAPSVKPDRIKVFLWSEKENMIPLTESKTLEEANIMY